MTPSSPTIPIPAPPRPRQRPLWPLLFLPIFIIAGVVIALAALVFFTLPRIGSSEDARRATTQASAAITITMIKNYNLENGSNPPSLQALVPKYMEKLPTDGWHRPFNYSLDANGVVTLTSLGADGKPGGRGDNTDLWWQYPAPIDAESGEGSPPTRPTKQ